MPLTNGDAPTMLSTADQDRIRRTLDVIAQHETFVSSPRLTAFLRFIVEETLQGRAAQIKAYTIATSVFALPDSFDPQNNSIVRVEAKRLRSALERVYADVTSPFPAMIKLTPGSYVPAFDLQGAQMKPDENPLVALPTNPPARVGWSRPAIAAGLASTIAGGALALDLSQPQIFRIFGRAASVEQAPVYGQPVVSVDIAANARGAEEMAARVKMALEGALANFKTLTVQDNHNASMPAGPFDYTISGRLDGDGALALRLLRRRTGEVLWTQQFAARDVPALSSADTRLTGEVTSRLAQRYGIIVSDLRQQILRGRNPHSGYGCILAADFQLVLPDAVAYRTVEECLQKAIAEHPGFAPARSAYARLLVDRWLSSGMAEPDGKTLEKAAQLAEEAIFLQPYNARSHFAQFAVRFADHRFEAAFEAGARALAMNPNATDITASIAAARILRGQYEEGRALLHNAGRSAESLPALYDVYLFVGAYMRDDFEEAGKRARRRALERFPLGIVAKMLMAAKGRDTAGLQKWSAKLQDSFPAFAKNLEASLIHNGLHATIARRFLDDLQISI